MNSSADIVFHGARIIDCRASAEGS
jgi:hypothetical protein